MHYITASVSKNQRVQLSLKKNNNNVHRCGLQPDGRWAGKRWRVREEICLFLLHENFAHLHKVNIICVCVRVWFWHVFSTYTYLERQPASFSPMQKKKKLDFVWQWLLLWKRYLHRLSCCADLAPGHGLIRSGSRIRAIKLLTRVHIHRVAGSVFL